MERRDVLFALGTAMLSLAGCLGQQSRRGGGGGSPQEPATPRLGDIRLDNEDTTSHTVYIQVIQNESIVFQESQQVPADTASGGQYPIVYMDTPNTTGTFVVKARLGNHGEWKQVQSTDPGLDEGGCFAAVASINSSDAFSFTPAGKSCELPPEDEQGAADGRTETTAGE